jgi:hypothetical protein
MLGETIDIQYKEHIPDEQIPSGYEGCVCEAGSARRTRFANAVLLSERREWPAGLAYLMTDKHLRGGSPSMSLSIGTY